MALSIRHGSRVLIVEDNEAIRAIALTILVRKGCVVLQARTAGEALEILSTDPCIDLVFSDINLPGGRTGLQLCEDVAHLWPDVPVVLTTGDPRLLHDQSHRPSMVFKPFRTSELVAAVGAALQLRRRPEACE